MFAFFLLQQNITEVAEAFGYTIYSKLLQVSNPTPAALWGGGVYKCTFSFGLWLFLCIPSYLGQDAELLPLISDPLHRPFTMLWPTDAAFNTLSEKRQKWLYHREHRDVLASYLKAHMIRDTKVNVRTNRLVLPEAACGPMVTPERPCQIFCCCRTRSILVVLRDPKLFEHLRQLLLHREPLVQHG